MNHRLSNIISLLQEQHSIIKTCERHISNLKKDALSDCPILIGDTAIVNYGYVHIGKTIQVINRTFCLKGEHDSNKAHWFFSGMVLRKDNSVSQRWGQSIYEIK